MVALFAPNLRDVKITRGTYRYISRIENVLGITFTSVIEIYTWDNTKEKIDAYRELRERQPELFK